MLIMRPCLPFADNASKERVSSLLVNVGGVGVDGAVCRGKWLRVRRRGLGPPRCLVPSRHRSPKASLRTRGWELSQTLCVGVGYHQMRSGYLPSRSIAPILQSSPLTCNSHNPRPSPSSRNANATPFPRFQYRFVVETDCLLPTQARKCSITNKTILACKGVDRNPRNCSASSFNIFQFNRAEKAHNLGDHSFGVIRTMLPIPRSHLHRNSNVLTHRTHIQFLVWQSTIPLAGDVCICARFRLWRK